MNGTRHLFLTGFRGTGKSTVGSILSHRLGLPAIDLDQVIELRAGKSIREIFSEGGELAFRSLESESLREAVEREQSVIALGGGAILREGNRDLIRVSGTCFWLDADAETLADRLAGDSSTTERRPALTNLPGIDEIRHLLDSRQPLYRLAADHRVETAGRGAEQVAEEILSLWLGSR